MPKELGAAAEVSAGGGGRGLAREIVVMVGAMVVLLTVIYASAGWVVEALLPRISVEREQAWFGAVDYSGKLAEEPGEDMQRRVEHARALLAKLSAVPEVPAFEFRLMLMKGSEPNAFALPGGVIGVTAPLLELLEDDTALAFVLGHELGHFIQRDHLRRIGRQLGRGLAWALLFGDGGDAINGQLTALLDLRYSRTQEAGADVHGLRLVQAVYGTTAGTDRLFVWLEQNRGQPEWSVLFSSHPGAGDRLTALRAEAVRLARTKKPAS